MAEARATSVVDKTAGTRRGPALAWLMAAVLMLAGTLSWLDRGLPNILIEPIRADLRVDDTAIALMNGTAFALCYGAVSLPLGWAADRYNRVRIIGAAVLVWSALTLAAAWANGFWTLFACRMGVGLGEAALAPAAYSLLASRFPAADLPRGLALLTLGAPLGSAAAWAGGGALYQHFAAVVAGGGRLPAALSAWRLTFACIGAAGMIVAALVATLRNQRGRAQIVRGYPRRPQCGYGRIWSPSAAFWSGS